MVRVLGGDVAMLKCARLCVCYIQPMPGIIMVLSKLDK